MATIRRNCHGHGADKLCRNHLRSKAGNRLAPNPDDDRQTDPMPGLSLKDTLDRPKQALCAMQNGAMDDIVLQAMVKWPKVPACYGWLGLDARGRWYLRDETVQSAGGFAQSRGDWLQHDKLLAFIARNYGADPQGQWFFQNGPQRVYVELESTPWIWRIGPGQTVQSHTGLSATVSACLVDELGRVYLATSLGLGLVHSQDVALAADAIEKGDWIVQNVRAEALSEAFGYVGSPARRQERSPY